MDIARSVIQRTASTLSSLPASLSASMPSWQLSLAVTTAQASKAIPPPGDPLQPTSKKDRVFGEKLRWTRQMVRSCMQLSLAVPLYRAALHNTRHSVAITRSLLTLFPTPVPPKTDITETTIPRDGSIVLPGMRQDEAEGSIPAEWVMHDPGSTDAAAFDPSHPFKADDTVVLYLHGGAFIMGSKETHRPLTSSLSQTCSAPILAISYRLAPEHTFPLPLHDAISAYTHLLRLGNSTTTTDPSKKRRSNIVLAGDSAGAGLCMSLSLWLRDHAHLFPDVDPTPRGLVAMAPWVDLTHSTPSFTLNASTDYLPASMTDPIFLASGRRSHAYTHSDTMNVHPYVSPLFATPSTSTRDGAGGGGGGGAPGLLPPTLIQVGEKERLRDEGVLVALDGAWAQAAGGTRCEVWEGMPHVFQVFGGEAAGRALKRIGDWVRGLTSSSSSADETPDVKEGAEFVAVGVDGRVVNMGADGARAMIQEGEAELARLRRRQAEEERKRRKSEDGGVGGMRTGRRSSIDFLLGRRSMDVNRGDVLNRGDRGAGLALLRAM
ncbi:hypothetical protein HK101_009460 [Irineochytrium annulatum]|nr:hypothetical protein HK101_009460 [Irineochytrium annulatum]